MSFEDRAVSTFIRDVERGALSGRSIRDVLRSKNPDVSEIYKFLSSSDEMVRCACAKIIGKHGLIQPLIDAAIEEKDRMTSLVMIEAIGKRGEGLKALEEMLGSGDKMVLEALISMFRNAGDSRSLFLLLFDKDDSVVKRIKQYIHEQQEAENRENSIIG